MVRRKIVLWVGINTCAGFFYWQVQLEGVLANSKWERIKFGCRKSKVDIIKISGKVASRSKPQSVWTYSKGGNSLGCAGL